VRRLGDREDDARRELDADGDALVELELDDLVRDQERQRGPATPRRPSIGA